MSSIPRMLAVVPMPLLAFLLAREHLSAYLAAITTLTPPLSLVPTSLRHFACVVLWFWLLLWLATKANALVGTVARAAPL
jgi:hypothetical protein